MKAVKRSPSPEEVAFVATRTRAHVLFGRLPATRARRKAQEAWDERQALTGPRMLNRLLERAAILGAVS